MLPPNYPNHISGERLTFSPANPAAGSPFSYSPTAYGRYQLLGFKIQLNCTVAVANRQLVVFTFGGATQTPELLANEIQLASSAVGYNGIINFGNPTPPANLPRHGFHIPPAWIFDGQDGFVISALNRDGGDQFSAIWLDFMFWPTAS